VIRTRRSRCDAGDAGPDPERSEFIGQPGGVGIFGRNGHVAVALTSAVPMQFHGGRFTTIPSATAETASLGDATITNTARGGIGGGGFQHQQGLTLGTTIPIVPLDVAGPGFRLDTSVIVPIRCSGGWCALLKLCPSDFQPLAGPFQRGRDKTLVTGLVSFSPYDFIAAQATFSCRRDIR